MKTTLLYLGLLLGCLQVYSQAGLNLCQPDTTKMVALRSAPYRNYQYRATLVGPAIKSVTSNNKDVPFSLHFDTGSWTLSVPGGAVDISKVTILETNVTDSWGTLADKVSGTVGLRSTDGTQYLIEGYIFYALKSNATTYMPDDRTSQWSKGIIGAFPSIDPNSNLPSLPYALANKYSPQGPGYGIASTCPDNIQSGWGRFRSYLAFGITDAVARQMSWRSDIPNASVGKAAFCPEVVPGFNVTVRIPDSPQTVQTKGDLKATIDTGAPDLTLRLGEGDPQTKAPFDTHFVRQGIWKQWLNSNYESAATTLVNGNVTVSLTADDGSINSYSFPVGLDPMRSPNSLIAGTFNGAVPFPSPANRINLGNSLFFYCPFVYYDIARGRVGFAKMKRRSMYVGERLVAGDKLFSADGSFYALLQNDGNFCVYRTQGNGFIWCNMNVVVGVALEMRADGNLVAVNPSGQIVWTTGLSSSKAVQLVLGNDGRLRLFDAEGNAVWTQR